MSSSDWFAKKLNTQPVPEYRPPVYQPQQSTPPTQQQAPYLPPDVRDHRLPASATNSSRCPGCGSGNYGKATPESAARCYDCGYPLQQSGSGVSGINTGQAKGPVMPSKQLSTANNYNPQGIIGHI